MMHGTTNIKFHCRYMIMIMMIIIINYKFKLWQKKICLKINTAVQLKVKKSTNTEVQVKVTLQQVTKAPTERTGIALLFL